MIPEQMRKIMRAAQEDRPAPDGPVIEQFNCLALADAIEQECARAAIVGWPKVSLHMDIEDARLLAGALRR